ncbi:hypothetical protein [Dictyobacter aurantiacus]|uniref:Uncharacterized protein n=1 Tax=Dictyobacter aurantiacus TaxID=1936993 RepID=A0A401ZEL4_9CHLR|nr:hypothetical protein [Dictyobacter aurantiacus]GCE05263.1 hypothetical protein KDAU_25920 [Dictyobacter aurantiacus]
MQKENQPYIHAIPPTRKSFPARNFATTTAVPAFNNVGISTSKNLSAANFDGANHSYSYDALLSTNLEPGLPFVYDGLQFNWPNINHVDSPTSADNWQANGQVLPLSQTGTDGRLGFIGSAANGSYYGNPVITFSDNSTQTVDLNMSDWTLGGGTQPLAYRNKIVSAMSKRDGAGGEQNVKTYLFYDVIYYDGSKTPVSVTLPKSAGNRLHIFAYSNTFAPDPGYNNVGMSNDAYTTPGNFDGAGNSYSSADISWGTGYTIYSDPNITGDKYEMAFQWPDVLPGTPDNYQADGQTIPVTPVADAAKIGFVGAATGGPSYGAGYISYDDGTRQAFTLGFSDWTLNAYTHAPSFGNRYFDGMTYRNTRGGQQNTRAFLFYTDVALLPGKTVTSVTLPASTNQGKIHVYSIATGVAGFYDNVGVTADNSPVFGNFDGAGHSYSGVAMSNAGVTFTAPGGSSSMLVNGITFKLMYGAGGSPDNWVAHGQAISVNPIYGMSTLGFIGSAVNGSSTGKGLITYTDGTTQEYSLSFSDWCAPTPQYNNSVVATMPYRNSPYGTQSVKNRLYYTEISVQSDKTIANVQLPTTTGGLMHIFAVAGRSGTYNNVGISNQYATKLGNFDGVGSSYDEHALALNNIASGLTYQHGGFNFSFSDSGPGSTIAGWPDNYIAKGQTLDVTMQTVSNMTSIGFILSATNGGASGTATLTYTDGTTQNIVLGASDWCDSSTVARYNVSVAASMPYRNTPTGQQNVKNYLYFSSFSINSSKRVQTVTLPNVYQLHIFSIAFK